MATSKITKRSVCMPVIVVQDNPPLATDDPKINWTK
jgi:hypothetical protein